ncbi:MAG: ABC transporter permease [Acidobacteria bacterium]|nr:ABC transporter permease [Acidobacteriota bacterium]
MLELVLANLRVRPFRTLISVIGVALGVILVVLFTGLAKGMTNDLAKRVANWKAEIVFTRPGAMDASSSNASVNLAYVQKLKEFEGVEAAVPVLRYFSPDNKSTWGVRMLEGVDWQPFAAMNDIRIVAGRPPQANNEIILDERQMQDDRVNIGDDYELFGGKHYTIVGVFSPPSGARIKMTLAALQEVEQTEKCSYILVKLKTGADPVAVANKINEALPGNKITLTQELVADAQDRIPGLSTFLRVLVVLGAFVSTVFVLLSMYTTITERRKEIGILKSLGASTGFIIGTIEGEAFMIGILGVILGGVVAVVASQLIGRSFSLTFEFSTNWIITAVAIAILGSLFGALYPAWRASLIDPVEVMVNE